MTATPGTLEDLVDLIRGKAPGFLDLLTAKTESDFDSALEPIIAGAIMHLEKNSKNFSTLGEVELTAVFTASMTIPGLVVTQEAHSNGHVDITVEAVYSNPPKIRLGEAKLYGGYSYHVKGVGQLVGRYSTGREGRGLILAYHRSPNIAGAITTLREEMDKTLPHTQKGKTTDSVVNRASHGRQSVALLCGPS